MSETRMRKVCITCGMHEDYLLILTDAPKEAIEKWCCDYNKEMEDGVNTYFDSLKRYYTVKVLADSELHDFDMDDIYCIGFDEHYDLSDYPVEDEEGSKVALKNLGFKTICFRYRGLERFEVVCTNAPMGVIALHVAYMSTCFREGIAPKGGYFPIAEMGYEITALGADDNLSETDMKNAVIDATFYYEYDAIEQQGDICGILFKHGADDYGYWEGFILSVEDEEKITKILSSYDTQGWSLRGTMDEIIAEMR